MEGTSRFPHQNKKVGNGKTEIKMDYYNLITSIANIDRAISNMCKGKGHRKEVRYILGNRDKVAEQIRNLLISDSYKCSKAMIMTRVENGKERHITYTKMLPDALVRHCVMNIFFNVFTPMFDADVYCNLKGRGLKYGIERMKMHVKESGYRFYLKEDMHHYFESIDKGILLRIIKDKTGCEDRTLNLIRNMLSLCENGIAIGTYDCQLWANVYLMNLDLYLRNKYPNIRFGRYCDNIYILGDDVVMLHKLHQDIKSFVRTLKLKLNPCEFGRVEDGLRCMGVVIYPTHIRLSRRIKERIRRNSNIESYFGWCKIANTHNLIRKIMYKKFSDFKDIPEYITSFTGDKVEINRLDGKDIIITDCIIEKSKFSKKNGELRDRAKVAFKYENDDRDYVFFCSSQPILYYCSLFAQDKQKYFPMKVKIVKINKQYKFE